jgi:hypothetical protein
VERDIQMTPLGYVLLTFGVMVALYGQVRFLVVAWNRNLWWFFGCLFVPFVDLKPRNGGRIKMVKNRSAAPGPVVPVLGYPPGKVLEIMQDEAGNCDYDGEVRIVRFRQAAKRT